MATAEYSGRVMEGERGFEEGNLRRRRFSKDD